MRFWLVFAIDWRFSNLALRRSLASYVSKSLFFSSKSCSGAFNSGFGTTFSIIFFMDGKGMNFLS